MIDTEELISTLMKIRYLFKSMNEEPPTAFLVSSNTFASLLWEMARSDSSYTLIQNGKARSLVIAGIEFKVEDY